MTPRSPVPTVASAVAVRAGSLPDASGLDALVAQGRPVLFKGAAREWPLVAHSPEAIAEELVAAHSGEPVVVYRAPPETGGRFFYNPAFDGFNFTATRARLGDMLGELLQRRGEGGDALYIGSCDLGRFFPALQAEFSQVLPRAGMAALWIGNRTTAACHYDYSNNLAVCLAGRRRFTLFPPDAIGDLYPGPLEPTPGGQVVSLVDIAAPDLERFPRFSRAMAQVQVAEMEPGDVLVYPAMWWHQVEALDDFNLLLNLWWNAVPAWMDSPQVTLLHAILSLRDRPEGEKMAWRAIFDHYVFGDGRSASAEIPGPLQGPLAPLDEQAARRLRANVMRRLQR